MATPLLEDIEAFLTAHNMAPTRFGAEAISDRHFVRQVRSGRRVWPDTEERVRDFMKAHIEAAKTPAVAMCGHCSKGITDARIRSCTDSKCPVARKVAA